MSKIRNISISNFKAVSDFEADFNGCTALITGGNNTGKTSFLRGIIDRIRFIRPEVIVKNGEKEGKGEMTLTSGEKFVWEFNVDGKDKLTLVTTEGLKHPVTTELGKKYFPPSFDIDKFLQSSPKKQVEQLQAIVGLDFTDIDKRYEYAYHIRTERNREAEIYHVKLSKMMRVDPVQPIDLSELQAKKELEKNRLTELYQKNKNENDAARNEWLREKDRINKECSEHNAIQQKRTTSYNSCFAALNILTSNGYNGDATDFVEELLEKIEPSKDPAELYPVEPTYIQEIPDQSELDRLDAEILKASEVNAQARKYQEYLDYKQQTEAAKQQAEVADVAVKAIEQEKRKMIESAHMPKGITFGSDGILVDGLPLDKNQISTSKLHCAALRIASMNLGNVKTLHFDASFLDKNTLSEIHDWADQNNLQLLIERPDFEGGEIKYEIVEHVSA